MSSENDEDKSGLNSQFLTHWSKLNLYPDVMRRAARPRKALTGGEVVDWGPGVSHPAFSCRAYPTPRPHPIHPPLFYALFLTTLPHILLLLHSSWIFCYLSQAHLSQSSCPITHSVAHHHPLRGPPLPSSFPFPASSAFSVSCRHCSKSNFCSRWKLF